MFEINVDNDIKIKILEKRHAKADYALINQDRIHLREWLPWVDDIKEVSDVQTFIESSLIQFSSNSGVACGIWYQDEFAGVISLMDTSWSNKSTSIGYWLGSKFEGKGVMTKSCKKMIDYAFNELGLHRVEIQCATENKKSRSIPERLGFCEEGKIRESEFLYDHYVTHVVYGILKREWK